MYRYYFPTELEKNKGTLKYSTLDRFRSQLYQDPGTIMVRIFRELLHSLATVSKHDNHSGLIALPALIDI